MFRSSHDVHPLLVAPGLPGAGVRQQLGAPVVPAVVHGAARRPPAGSEIVDMISIYRNIDIFQMVLRLHCIDTRLALNKKRVGRYRRYIGILTGLSIDVSEYR